MLPRPPHALGMCETTLDSSSPPVPWSTAPCRTGTMGWNGFFTGFFGGGFFLNVDSSCGMQHGRWHAVEPGRCPCLTDPMSTFLLQRWTWFSIVRDPIAKFERGLHEAKIVQPQLQNRTADELLELQIARELLFQREAGYFSGRTGGRPVLSRPWPRPPAGRGGSQRTGPSRTRLRPRLALSTAQV